MRALIAGFLLATSLLAHAAQAQVRGCPDAGDEPHHQVLFQNAYARVLLLDLPRLAATASYCPTHPYLYIVTGNGRSSRTVDGQGTMSHDWAGGEARFIYAPMQHIIRNESGSTYRELIVETLRDAAYDADAGNLDMDLFPAGLGSTKPTWTVSFTRGGLTASKIQLAPGAGIAVSGGDHVLLALSDLELEKQISGKSVGALDMAAQDVQVLPGGSELQLVNDGHQSANLILVEF
jgi:hypothetical protein